MRLSEHIGVIPDGDRRWAKGQGMDKSEGYVRGISPGTSLYRVCRELGINEMSFYGFTADNTRRPSIQRQAFTRACVAVVEEPTKEDASLPILGSAKSPMFPQGLLSFTAKYDFGKGGMKINSLVNCSWKWDLGYKNGAIGPGLKVPEVSRIGLIIQ